MEEYEVTNSISKLLWFFYRVIFNAIPAIFFIFFTLFSLYLVIPFGKYKAVIDFFNLWGTGGQIFFFIAAVVFIQYILEAIVIKLTYRTLGFKYLSDNEFYELRKKYLNPNGIKSNARVPFSIYNLMEVKSLINNDKVFEHIYYSLSREFLFNNTWIVILLCALFYFPSLFLHYFRVNITEQIIYYQIVEVILISGIVLLASYFSRRHFAEDRYYHFKTFEAPKKIIWNVKIIQISIVIIPFFIGLITLVFHDVYPWVLFGGFNLVFFH
jgi:hypothetical protein